MRKLNSRKDNYLKSQIFIIDINTEIQELEQGKIHKCRQSEKSEDMRRQYVTGSLKKEYTRKLRMN